MPFKILTELSPQTVRQYLTIFAINSILLSVQEPIWDFVLTGILHDGDYFLNLFISKITSSLAEINISFFEDEVGISATNSLNGSHSKHDLTTSINGGVEDTQNLLEIWGDNQRHFRSLFLLFFTSKLFHHRLIYIGKTSFL